MKIFASRKGAWWRSDGFLGALVVLSVLSLHLVTDVFGGLERKFYDFGSTLTSRVASDKVAVIAIDDASIARIGRWPWSRDVHATLIDRLAAAGARTIAHTAFFFEPQTDRGLTYIRKIREIVPPPTEGSPPSDDTVGRLNQVIAEAELALDTDAKLAGSVERAKNVVLPSVYRLGEPLGRADQPLPPSIIRYTLEDRGSISVPSVGGQQPLVALSQFAAGVGHLNQVPDTDGTLRREPLLVGYYGRAVPSMALMVAAHSLNLGMSDLRVQPDQAGIELGRLRVPADAQGFMLPQFYRDRDGKPAFRVDSFHDVLTGKIPIENYAGKIVLIGGTAAGIGASFPTPVSPALAPVEYVAHVTSSLLNEHFLSQPTWSNVVVLGALVLVAVYLAIVLPRASAGMGAALTAVLFVVLVGGELGMLVRAHLWIELVLPAALLVIGHLALTTKRFLVTEAGKQRSDEESAETNRMMGLALQGQGQLDMAFDRFLRVPRSDLLMDNLGNLALDFERKRQFNKAQSVYEHMARLDPTHQGLQAKLGRVRNLAETVILGGGSGHPGGTLLLADGAVEKPMLGRYQIEKELGKGAMGVVYLGKDPKIGRVVAIKTMALSQEFEGSELDDARERFFREAETAGRLQHQHIVTIFDAGEEHDLAYIAMEFLRGRDLVDHCQAGRLLPVAQVLSIVARVAEALAYAHAQHVVHRDIKPANIMWDQNSDTVKVTDFGIARITDASRTRTGLVLGTPSFMSPEQIAGQKVDGRSDLYSLGVMLFQMLTGVLPFRGDSLAELMYKIASEEAPDPRAIRPELPPEISVVVARALSKRPGDRYPDGAQMASDLRAVRTGLAEQPDRTTSAPVTPAGRYDQTEKFFRKPQQADGSADEPSSH